MGLLAAARMKKQGRKLPDVKLGAKPKKAEKSPDASFEEIPETIPDLEIADLQQAENDFNAVDGELPVPEPPQTEHFDMTAPAFGAKSSSSFASMPAAAPEKKKSSGFFGFLKKKKDEEAPAASQSAAAEEKKMPDDEFSIPDELEVPSPPELELDEEESIAPAALEIKEETNDAETELQTPPELNADSLSNEDEMFKGIESGDEKEISSSEDEKQKGKWQIFDIFKKKKEEAGETAQDDSQLQPMGTEDDEFPIPTPPELPPFEIPEPPTFEPYVAPKPIEMPQQTAYQATTPMVPAVVAQMDDEKTLPAVPAAEQAFVPSGKVKEKYTKAEQKVADRRQKLELDVAKLKDQLASLTSEMEQKKRLMEENERMLDEKERSIDDKIRMADEKIRQLQEVKGHIENARTDINEKTGSIDRAKTLADQVYADRQALESRKSEIEAKEKMIAQLNSQLNDKEQRLKEFEARLKDWEAKLTKKEEEMAGQYKGLADNEFKQYIEEILKDVGTNVAKARQVRSHPVFTETAKPELVSYIAKHLSKGFKQERIISALTGAGWTNDEINAAMEQALGNSGYENQQSSAPQQQAQMQPQQTSRRGNQEALQQIADLMSRARSMVNNGNAQGAQDVLQQAKEIYDSLYIDENQKQMLRYELQDIKTEIDLALLS